MAVHSARGPYAFTEARRRRWLAEGRGLGDGADYRPWLQVRNVRSRGRKHRIRGILHDRVLHLMSDLERNALFHFERRAGVTDIKEQFPLDREATRRIAASMGVPHPRDPATGVEIVMTTDLVVACRDGAGRPVARPFSVKQASDLLDRRVQEKQEIERRYWRDRGFRWDLLTDAVLRDTPYFEAIRWIRDWFYVDEVGGLDERAWASRRRRVLAALGAASRGTLGDFTSRVEGHGGFGVGEVLSTLRHLAARGLVGFDPRGGVPTLDAPVGVFSVAAAHFARRAA